MTVKHTPAPWHTGNEVGGQMKVYDASGNLVAAVAKFGDFTRERRLADAALIAKAPETAAERDRLKAINAELVAALEEVLADALSAPVRVLQESTLAQAMAILQKVAE